MSPPPRAPVDAALFKDLPGAICWAIDADGRDVFEPRIEGYQSHLPGAGPLTKDSVFNIASCTKIITAAAAMQCVERGLIGLDEPVEKHLPELKDPKVLMGWEIDHKGTEKPVLRDAHGKITLRHLLTHTSGLSVFMFDASIQKWLKYKGWPLANPDSLEKMSLPLVFDPGEYYCYGWSIDWAGILIERLNKVSTLTEYLQPNIFAPLGMFSTTFKPRRSAAIMSRLVEISQRNHEGGWEPETLQRWLDYSENVALESGGFGLWSTASDYLSFLRAILNGGEGIFKSRRTWEEMFTPQFPDDGWLQQHEHLPNIVKMGGNLLFPEMRVNMALGVMLLAEDSAVGCKAGTAQAGGLKNTYWWVDFRSGIAGIVFAQYLPFEDKAIIDLWKEFEAAVYWRIGQTRPRSSSSLHRPSSGPHRI